MGFDFPLKQTYFINYSCSSNQKNGVEYFFSASIQLSTFSKSNFLLSFLSLAHEHLNDLPYRLMIHYGD